MTEPAQPEPNASPVPNDAPSEAPVAGDEVPHEAPRETTDPVYREAVTELLGALAYGELRAFTQLAKDSELAPRLRYKEELAYLAAAELKHFTALTDRIKALGGDPEAVMQPFVEAIDSFHDRTRPSNWLEGLVKAFVGEGIAQDFYREVASYVDEETKELVLGVLEDTGQADFVVSVVRQAIEEDERIAGRLALWGRRLVGEAITQAQRIGVERDALSSLLVGVPGRGGADLAELGRMFVRITDEHTRRMERLGLSA